MLNYDPDQIPPNYDIARLHQKANRVAVGADHTCPCCGYVVKDSLFPLSTDKEQLTFLGSGYPLYFTFIKHCIILLSIHLMAVGQYSLVINYQGRDCLSLLDAKHQIVTKQYDFCLWDTISAFSLANRRSRVDIAYIDDMLSIISALLMMCYLLYFRMNQHRLDVLCDIEENTPADYTLMVYDIDDPSRLKEFFEQELFGEQGESIKVKKITLAYDLGQISTLQKQREAIIDEKKQAYNKNTQFHQDRLDMIDISIQEQLEKCEFSGVAFISFKYDHMKRSVMSAAKIHMTSIICNMLTGLDFSEGKILDYYGHEIKVQVAPEPTDVNWQSIYPWAKESVLRRIIGQVINIICSTVLAIAVYILTLRQSEVLGVMEERHRLKEDDIFSRKYIIVHLYSAGYSILTCLINSLILDTIVRKIVSFQAYPTLSQANISIAYKLSVMMFLNSAFMQFIIMLQNGNIYKTGGLVYNITFFFGSNAIVPPIIQYIDIPYRFQQIQRYYYMHFGTITQSEAQLFEYPEHAIEQGYADVVKTLNVTFFFGPLLPSGYILSIFGLLLYYWAEKYTLLRRKSVKHSPSFQLSSNMTDSLQLIPVIYLLSNFIFKYLVMGYFSGISILSCFLSLLYHFIPNKKLVELLWDFDSNVEYIKYNEMHFLADYDRENPVTQKKALRHWIRRNAQHEKHKIEKLEDYATLQKKAAELKLELDLFD